MKMKKSLCLLLAAILLLSLAACGGEAEATPTPEQTQFLDMESIAGYWKYDDYDYYFSIYAESVWALYDMAGNEQSSGDLTLEDDLMTLSSSNGAEPILLSVNSFDQLTDGDGETLSRYNPSDDVAEHDEVSLAPIVDCWKYDAYNGYYIFYDDNTWICCDMAGNQTDNGDYTFDGSTITLVSANGMNVLPMTIVDANQLADTDGDTLSRYDPSAVEVADDLPHANDPLTQSVALYETDGVYVSYPDTIKVVKVVPENRFVNLDAVSENDVHHTILANYIEMGTGYDKHFDCGADSARYVLLQMADIVMNAIWDSNKIVGYSKFEFTDNGDYFGLRVWGVMTGAALSNCDLAEIPMVLEIRYVGPTGYLPVMMCIAENERIDEYYGLMHNMFDSMTYPTGWSTTPTRKPASNDYNPHSDPGDSGYWYDEYYYVDDDGVNPYDSDAGGYWSDPGETEDNMYWDGDMWMESQNADW